jgi:hypothetical protein
MRSRPLIDRLLDCQIRIWRPTTTNDTIGVEEREYAPSSVVDAFLNRPVEPETPSEGGLAPTGGVRWYGRPDIDVLPRDLCEVLSGPEEGKIFEVNAPPVRPKSHHTQVDCIEWNGVLPPITP